MSNGNIVNIRGKDYMTVAGRVQEAHERNEIISITTELISSDPILYKATVVTNKGTFTGHSAVYLSLNKLIEKQAPYEVAETSAVGRALGFAGFGIVEGLATAEEVDKAENTDPDWTGEKADKAVKKQEKSDTEVVQPDSRWCSIHEDIMPRLLSKTKFDSEGNPKPYYAHEDSEGKLCFGSNTKT